MAFDVHYAPINYIEQASYLGGLGDYNRYQQQQRMQMAQLAQQDAAQRRALEANMISQGRAQAFNAQQAGMDRAFRFGAMGADMARDAAMRREARAWEVEDRDAALGAADARFKAGMEGDRLAAEERARLAADHDARTAAMWAARDREDSVAAGLKSGTLYYTPQQKQSMHNIRAAMQAAQTSGMLTPEELAQEMQSLQEDYDKHRLSPFERLPDEQPPPPLKERVPEATYQEPVTSPDGTFMGYNVWREETRNGQTRMVPQFIAHKPDDTPEAQRKERWQKFVEANSKPTLENPTPPSVAELRKRFAEIDAGPDGKSEPEMAKFGGGMQLPPTGATPPPPPAPGTPTSTPPPPQAKAPAPQQPPANQPAPGSLVENEGQTFWIDPQSGQPLPVFPRNSAASTQQGALVVDERGVVMLVQGPGEYVPVGEVAQPEQQLPPEIAALPSGAVFQAPDGSWRRKP